MRKVYCDVETRSLLDLRDVGAINYCSHESTEPLCFSYSIDGRDVVLLTPIELVTSEELRDLAADPDTVFVAHNAAFEQAFWQHVMVERYGFPPIPIARWRCTMAKTKLHGLPGGLGAAAKLLKLAVQKDEEGKSKMLKLSRPRRKAGSPWWTPDEAPNDFLALYAYNKQDVETTILLDQALRDLPPREQIIWGIDQRINQTGLLVDVECINKAMALQDEHEQRLLRAFVEITGLESPTQTTKLLVWLNEQLDEEIPNLQAPTLVKLRAQLAPTNPRNIRVLTVIQARQELSKASLAKMPAMLRYADNAGILRENWVYHGAHTGRWTGKNVQVTNIARAKDDVYRICDTINHADYDSFVLFYPNVTTSLSHGLRGMIIARPTKKFVGGDLAQMEARTLAWLAGDENKLQKYRDGIDTYCVLAETIYGYPVTKKMEERQTGKVADLSLGFGGGIAAFVNMSKAYNLDISPVAQKIWDGATPIERENAVRSFNHYQNRAEEPIHQTVGVTADIIKQRWREAHPEIVQFWCDLEDAAVRACVNKQPVSVGRLKFFTHGKFLFVQLPTGKTIAYLYPKVEMPESGYGKAQVSYLNGAYGRVAQYGGRWAENVVQATQRELLVDCMYRLEQTYPVVYHNYDECVSEVDEDADVLDEYVSIMKMVPKWANGLPVNVDGWQGKRYGK